MFDQNPENRKQLDALQVQDATIEEQFDVALHSTVLTRRQSQAYRKMLGAPFDPTRVSGGPKGASGTAEAAK